MPKNTQRRDGSSGNGSYRHNGTQDVLVSCLKTQNWEKLLQLLQMGHNPNQQMRSFDVRLLLSAEAEKMRRLEPYLERYLLHNVTVLHLAVMVNDMHAINILLNFGAKINEFCGVRDKDLSVLMLAIVIGHSQLLDMLIRRGANYSLWNRDLRTPLDLSVMSNNTEAVRCLAKYKRFFYNKAQKSRLTICEYVRKYAIPDRLEIVGRMVEIGYDLGQCSDGSILTLLLDLLQTNHKHTVRVFELLLNASPDLLSIKKQPSDESVLHLAARKSALPLIQLFLLRGLPTTVLDANGNTPLHCLTFDCLSTDGIEIFNELIKRDADVFLKNKSGVSAFELAVRVQNPRLAAVFAEHLSKPSSSLSHRFVIHQYLLERAGKDVDPHVLKAFLSYGLSFDAKNEEKQTTVHCLLSRYDGSSCEVLTKCLSILTQDDGMLDVADSNGMTPMMLAVHKSAPIQAVMKLVPTTSIDQVTRDGQDVVSLLLTRFHGSGRDRMALLKLVIDKGASLNNTKRFGCKALISAAKRCSLKPLMEPLLLLKSGYLPHRDDIEDACDWDLQLLDHVLRFSSSAVVRSHFPNILLSVIANFLPQNPPLDLILKVIRKLTDEFHIDVNYYEKKTSVWHLLIGSAHRYPILPLIDHFLSISNANLNLGADWHDVGIPLTYALIVGEFKIAEKLIHKMSDFEHVSVERMKLKFGFSGLLVSLCKRGFQMPASFFERGFGQDLEIIRELDWFRKYLNFAGSGQSANNFQQTISCGSGVGSDVAAGHAAFRDRGCDGGNKRSFSKCCSTVSESGNKKVRRQTRE